MITEGRGYCYRGSLARKRRCREGLLGFVRAVGARGVVRKAGLEAQRVGSSQVYFLAQERLFIRKRFDGAREAARFHLYYDRSSIHFYGLLKALQETIFY